MWGVRREDGSVCLLPTASGPAAAKSCVQTELNPQSQQSMSVAHITEFTGDHVTCVQQTSQTSWRTSNEGAQLTDWVRRDGLSNKGHNISMSAFYKPSEFMSDGQSFFFFIGTQEKEPANFGASLGRFVLKQKLPQPRSHSLPTLSCHQTVPTLSSLSVLLSTGLMFCMAMRPTTQLTDTLAMSTKTATTVTKRRRSQF